MPGEGPGGTARLLRLPGGALGASADDEPIESTFATIRLRTAKTRNCLSEKTALSLVHQLAMSAQKRWRRLRGFRHLAEVIADVRFVDGVNDKETGGRAAGFRTAIHNI